MKSAGNTKQQKNCKKGWGCGFTCLPRTKKNCNKGIEGQAKTLTEWLEKNNPEKKRSLPNKGPTPSRKRGETFRGVSIE